MGRSRRQRNKQNNLVITPGDEPQITIDSLEVAQFVYLLLKNEKIRDVMNTLGKRAVLILGRFSEPRKRILDAVREALRHKGYLPIVFDFERPTHRDFTETIRTRSHGERAHAAVAGASSNSRHDAQSGISTASTDRESSLMARLKSAPAPLRSPFFRLALPLFL
jgi:hypothetical protein